MLKINDLSQHHYNEKEIDNHLGGGGGGQVITAEMTLFVVAIFYITCHSPSYTYFI